MKTPGKSPETEGVARHFGAINVLGVRVHCVGVSETVSIVVDWLRHPQARCRVVVHNGMHGINLARRRPELRAALSSADLFFPDGVGILWVGRLHGMQIEKKNTGGDELVLELCAASDPGRYRHFFLGDTERTLAVLEKRLRADFPTLQIAGTLSPPFRVLTAAEDDSVVDTINESGADILWVGLGCPKQELWMAQFRDRLRVPVVIGVGAAFKYVARSAARAPTVVQNIGLEWLWRLAHEPRQTWRRYVIDGPDFALHAVAEALARRIGAKIYNRS